MEILPGLDTLKEMTHSRCGENHGLVSGFCCRVPVYGQSTGVNVKKNQLFHLQPAWERGILLLYKHNIIYVHNVPLPAGRHEEDAR